MCRLCRYPFSSMCNGASAYHVTLGMNERQAQDLMLEESRLGIHLKTAKADAKMAGMKAKRNARRLHELTAKEDRAR